MTPTDPTPSQEAPFTTKSSGTSNAKILEAAIHSATALHAAGYDAQKCIVALPMLLRYIKNKRSFGGLKTEDLLAQLRRGKGRVG